MLANILLSDNSWINISDHLQQEDVIRILKTNKVGVKGIRIWRESEDEDLVEGAVGWYRKFLEGIDEALLSGRAHLAKCGRRRTNRLWCLNW